MSITGPHEFSQAKQECDLVMKGGVTSGIVYPPAVLVLAKQYRFCSIGGASAGAIAAAITAAAEYARETGGFTRLQAVSDQLSTEGFLLGLFRPSPVTRPLLETLLGAPELSRALRPVAGEAVLPAWKKGLSVADALGGLLARTEKAAYDQGAAIGTATLTKASLAVGGATLGSTLLAQWLFARRAQSPVGFAPQVRTSLGISAALAGAAGLATYLVGRKIAPQVAGIASASADLLHTVTHKLPENAYGICTGRAEEAAPGDPEPLTDWLARSINEVAGLSTDASPLTFGQLKKQGVDLAMVTSNLSHGEPVRLPFENRFIFNTQEMQRFFPPHVVAHLEHCQYRSERVKLPNGYCFLPNAADLPVVFGTRLSLSFPLLISAIPLYTIDSTAFRGRERGQPKEIPESALQKLWFSDGGISSNFPIHFFDSWLPGRPTFGINLTAWPEEAFTAEGERLRETRLSGVDGENEARESDTALGETAKPTVRQTEPVLLPGANQPSQPEWSEINSLFGFLASIFSTAQNYRDNMQSRLPSYRERIVQVRLRANEGGINLNMPPEKINEIKDRGKLAGHALCEDFRFRHHLWVRFLVLMAELEQQANDIQRKNINLPELFREQLTADPEKFPYPRDKGWCTNAEQNLAALQALLENWKDQELFSQDCPRPNPVLRVGPRL